MDEIRLDKILLCIDNSDTSAVASEAALKLAKTFRSEVVGIHAYNAFMHEGAFKIMEPTLPEQYQKQEILQKQRGVHKKLINVGMEKISLSYLKPVEDSFRAEDIIFRSRVKEGKNFKTVNELLTEEAGDLVVVGSSGFNSNGNGFVGSVCLRVLRGNDRNFLIIKRRFDIFEDDSPATEKGFAKGRSSPRFVVCLDGSSSAISALRAARLFAEKFSAELHLVYVFDSRLHKEIFERLKESVINREGFAFNTNEQEKIHDEFIDKGLARVGNMILNKAEGEVFGADGNGQSAVGDGWGLAGEINSIPRIKKVFAGYIHKTICDYASETKADLVFLGRTGRHFVEGMDIGSVTENVVRFSPCSVFVAKQEDYRGWEL